jgi:hypothetical protein
MVSYDINLFFCELKTGLCDGEAILVATAWLQQVLQQLMQRIGERKTSF